MRRSRPCYSTWAFWNTAISRAADFGGARGSNAGDQFHELWALQRALSLLAPSVGLTALTVEGISSGVEVVDENTAAWEGVDCALYYGGTTNADSGRIELAQLKYSSANPGTKWTIARLISNSSKKGNNSVFRRFLFGCPTWLRDALHSLSRGAPKVPNIGT
jgi:hypothetical protein